MGSRIVLATLLLLALSSLGSQPSALATSWNFDFTPTGGGPGTVVHVVGVAPRSAILIQLGLAGNRSDLSPGGQVDGFQPIVVLGKIAPDPSEPTEARGIDTMVVIPSRWPNGRPITSSSLAIALTFLDNTIVGETAPRAFDFVPGIPATGDPVSVPWGLLTVSALALTLGLCINAATRFPRRRR